MYALHELRLLAETYCVATGLSRGAVSEAAAGHRKLFARLAAGGGCRAESAERAGLWFERNWPASVAWPLERRIVGIIDGATIELTRHRPEAA
jgi:hypothetical protein